MPAGFSLPAHKIPTPSTQLKSLNWSKIPTHKLKDTVWPEIQTDVVYDELDRPGFDDTFSAMQVSKTSSLQSADLGPCEDGRCGVWDDCLTEAHRRQRVAQDTQG
jgi:hypothetical protein